MVLDKMLNCLEFMVWSLFMVDCFFVSLFLRSSMRCVTAVKICAFFLDSVCIFCSGGDSFCFVNCMCVFKCEIFCVVCFEIFMMLLFVCFKNVSFVFIELGTFCSRFFVDFFRV